MVQEKGSTVVVGIIMCTPLEGAANQGEVHMSKRFRKLAHSLYECKYHVVFCPKYRYRMLKDEVAKFVEQEIYRLCSQKDGVEVIELNVRVDHVHLVLWIPPKYAVSNVVGFLKGKIAIKVFNRFPHVGRKYWGRHFWSRGYCVSTVGIDEERIRQYVKWQEKQEKQLEAIQGKLFD